MRRIGGHAGCSDGSAEASIPTIAARELERDPLCRGNLEGIIEGLLFQRTGERILVDFSTVVDGIAQAVVNDIAYGIEKIFVVLPPRQQ
jgi:hypothetical protein